MAFSLLGGAVSGSSGSNASQSASVYFVPTVTDSPAPLVSPYPAGQGLDTINSALPGSAALTTSTDPLSGVASSLGVSSTVIYLALAGVALYYFMARRK